MKEQAMILIEKKMLTEEERNIVKAVYPAFEALHLDYVGNGMWINNNIY
jgi:hypothetical protein